MTHTARLGAILMLIAWAPPRVRRIAPALAAALWSPLLAIAVVTVGSARALWRRLGSRRRIRDVDDQVELLAELLILGLTAGWGFAQTLSWAAPRLEDPLRGEVAALVRRMRHDGAGALDGAGGHGADLYRLVARAQITGAALVDAVDGFARERLMARRQRMMTAARRLPVILVFPLALLILPGFVLVTVAPTLIGALQRIGS